MKSFASSCITLLLFISFAPAQQEAPPTSIPLEKTLTPIFKEGAVIGTLESTEAYSNFRMILDYDSEEVAEVVFGENSVKLPPGKGRNVDITYEHCAGMPAHLRVWVDGKTAGKGRDLTGTSGERLVADAETSDEILRMDQDFTAMVKFNAGKNGGTLISKSMPENKWIENAKALVVGAGRIDYVIAGSGTLKSKSVIKTSEDYVAVIVSKAGKVSLFLDGKLEDTIKDFSAPDPKGSAFKVGSAAPDFGGDFDGEIPSVRFWKRALNTDEVNMLSIGKEDAVNTPDLNWFPAVAGGTLTEYGAAPGYAIRPVLAAGKGFVLHKAVVQPLALADHAELIRTWNTATSWERGDVIYNQLCVTCHGTVESPGSLPTAPRFHLGDLKNGSDPYRMMQTLEKGYGQMVAMPQYTTAQKYDVINYIRGKFFHGKNEKQLTPVDDDYLAMLPRGMTQQREKGEVKRDPQYLLQDFGNTLFWTLQVEPGNIAQKGIAVRVDSGPGGISKGNAWMLYEHDTMRLAACWTGDKFVDWKGIAFDGSHGSHTSIVGEKEFIFPNEPMWANPATGDFKDLRILGRDGLPYGSLPREWVHFQGVEVHGDHPVIRYTVGDCEIRETPRLGADGSFERLLIMGPSEMILKLKLDGENEASFKPGKNGTQLIIRYSDGKPEVINTSTAPASEKPASRRFAGTLTTEIKKGEDQGAWATDVFETPAPDDNPWQSWMRTSGFDFFDGGKSAAVCTWNGDVWIVDGIDQSEGQLKWQRICAGLFQPLGLKNLRQLPGYDRPAPRSRWRPGDGLH
jgi:mono/diheme cytochrome c family protein